MLVHDCSLHLLGIEAAVLVCVVGRAEVRGVVGQGRGEAGVGTEVVTVTSHTTEANNKQFYIEKVQGRNNSISLFRFFLSNSTKLLSKSLIYLMIRGEISPSVGFGSFLLIQQNCLNSFQMKSLQNP